MRRQSLLWLAMLAALGAAGCTSPAVHAPGGSGHALEGKKAPLFTAATLDDQPFNLAEHLGKSVVILDFWATWCGPCVAALPIISQVAGEYKSRGVEFYAVNLQEEADQVRAFLQEHKLDVPVVMDRDGKIAELYQAESIPQTVIIGKDGDVAVVHVGFGADLKSRLGSQLESLVAGEKLTGPSSPVSTEPQSAVAQQ